MSVAVQRYPFSQGHEDLHLLEILKTRHFLCAP